MLLKRMHVLVLMRIAVHAKSVFAGPELLRVVQVILDRHIHTPSLVSVALQFLMKITKHQNVDGEWKHLFVRKRL